MHKFVRHRTLKNLANSHLINFEIYINTSFDVNYKKNHHFTLEICSRPYHSE